MLPEGSMKELQERGYTVIPNLLSVEEADKYRSMYDDWIANFEGVWPPTVKSLIQKFRVGHMEPTWVVRLKCKPVFSEIWGTEKLLTSFDGAAIGRPPESGDEDFYAKGQSWLHVDQRWEREGLHGYQGAVYLEEAEADDWTFEVLTGSHKYIDSYYDECDYAVEQRKAHPTWRVRNYRDPEDGVWFRDNYGCKRIRIPVPKGGMVVWDSRLIHANTRPLINRKNAGRWRFVVFVCMAPAVWANEIALKRKQKAYNELLMTKHWPCDGISFFRDRAPRLGEVSIRLVNELPQCATTTEAKQLAGVLPYDDAPEDEELLNRKPKWRQVPVSEAPTPEGASACIGQDDE